MIAGATLKPFMATKLIVSVVLLAVGFLLGWYPQIQEVNDLRAEIAQLKASDAALQAKVSEAAMRQAGVVVYLELGRQNYAEAAKAATDFFDKVRELASQTNDDVLRSKLNNILAKRDPLTTDLARASPVAATSMQEILLDLYGRPTQ